MRSVLEIGAGGVAAGAYPASGLSEVDYIVSDIRTDEAERAIYYKQVPCLGGVALDSAAMPFQSNTFDAVIQRSVFGEYTMDPAHTNGSLENTYNSLYEAYRVLKEGGQIVIAEENTPWPPATPGGIGASLDEAGFSDITVYPCQSYQNPAWAAARGAYWALPSDYLEQDPTKYFPGSAIDPRWGFLITATKPGGETEAFEHPVLLHSIWQENRKRGWSHPDNKEYIVTLPFERRKAGEDDDTDTWDKIMIVSKDGTMTLAEYFAKHESNRDSVLFAQ